MVWPQLVSLAVIGSALFMLSLARFRKTLAQYGNGVGAHCHVEFAVPNIARNCAAASDWSESPRPKYSCYFGCNHL